MDLSKERGGKMSSRGIKKIAYALLAVFLVLSFNMYAEDLPEIKLTKKDIEDICSKFDNLVSLEGTGHLYYPGYAIDECELGSEDPNLIKQCIFERGHNIDIATLYANGQYVQQDFWQAISYVCKGSPVPAELTLMVKTLFEAIQKGYLKEKFDYCDHVTSSQSIAVCFDRKQSKAFQVIDQKFKEFYDLFTEKQKNAYDLLLKLAFQFFDARARNEQDLSGSLRSIFVTEWNRDQKEWLLEVLDSLEAGKLTIEKIDYFRIEYEMQEEYQKLIERFIESENQDYSFHHIFTKESIESTQEDFLDYRDAFANFVHIRYPKFRWMMQKPGLQKFVLNN